MSRKKGLWLGLAAGALVGGIVGTLFSPMSGRKLRQKLAGQARRRTRRVKAKGIKFIQQEVKKLVKR